MNKYLTHYLFPSCLVATVIASVIALHAGMPPSLIPGAITVASLVMVLLIERSMP